MHAHGCDVGSIDAVVVIVVRVRRRFVSFVGFGFTTRSATFRFLWRRRAWRRYRGRRWVRLVRCHGVLWSSIEWRWRAQKVSPIAHVDAAHQGAQGARLRGRRVSVMNEPASTTVRARALLSKCATDFCFILWVAKHGA